MQVKRKSDNMSSLKYLDDITATFNNTDSRIKETVNKTTDSYSEDEENNATANLVTKRLEKMENQFKKDKLIRTILNILFE